METASDSFYITTPTPPSQHPENPKTINENTTKNTQKMVIPSGSSPVIKKVASTSEKPTPISILKQQTNYLVTPSIPSNKQQNQYIVTPSLVTPYTPYLETPKIVTRSIEGSVRILNQVGSRSVTNSVINKFYTTTQTTFTKQFDAGIKTIASSTATMITSYLSNKHEHPMSLRLTDEGIILLMLFIGPYLY